MPVLSTGPLSAAIPGCRLAQLLPRPLPPLIQRADETHHPRLFAGCGECGSGRKENFKLEKKWKPPTVHRSGDEDFARNSPIDDGVFFQTRCRKPSFECGAPRRARAGKKA